MNIFSNNPGNLIFELEHNMVQDQVYYSWEKNNYIFGGGVLPYLVTYYLSSYKKSLICTKLLFNALENNLI